MVRTKKLTDAVYSPTNPPSEADIRTQIDGAIDEVFNFFAPEFEDPAPSTAAKAIAAYNGTNPVYVAHLADSAIRPDRSILDITTRLQTMFDNNPDGGTFYIPYSGDYQLTDSLQVPSNSHVILAHRLNLLCPNDDCAFRLENKTNIRIEGGSITGNTSTGNASQHGIKIDTCTYISVEHVNIFNTYQNGIYIIDSENVGIRRCKSENSLIAFYAQESSNILFEDLEANTPRFEYGVQFKSCTDSQMIKTDVDTPVDVGIFVNKNNEVGATTPENIKVINCKVKSVLGTGTEPTPVAIYMADGSNYVVESCEVDGATTGTGIRLNCDNSRVTNCTVENVDVHGIHIVGNKNIVKGNTVKGCQQAGIRDEGQNNEVVHNVLDGNNLANSSSLGNLHINGASYGLYESNQLILTTGQNNIRMDSIVNPYRVKNNVFINPVPTNDVRGLNIVAGSEFTGNGYIRFQLLRGIANKFADIRVINGRLECLSGFDGVPVTGTWVQGDKIWNSTLAAEGYEAELCTAAGTPGTWKGVGLIQA